MTQAVPVLGRTDTHFFRPHGPEAAYSPAICPSSRACLRVSPVKKLMEFRRAILPPSLGSCTRSVKASLYWTQARWPLSSLSEQALGSLELLQACRAFL